jgi:hypothetical protein
MGEAQGLLIATTPVYRFLSSIIGARELCSASIKKMPALALTSRATLRHNHLVREHVHCEKIFAQPMTSG